MTTIVDVSRTRRADGGAMAGTKNTGGIDVAIIGAGHNGLTCAAYLARRGSRWSCWRRTTSSAARR